MIHIIDIYYCLIYTSNRDPKGESSCQKLLSYLPLEEAKQCGFPGPSVFKAHKVFIRRNPCTGEVVLSPKPTSWQEFFKLVDQTTIPADFMTERQAFPAEERDLF